MNSPSSSPASSAATDPAASPAATDPAAASGKSAKEALLGKGSPDRLSVSGQRIWLLTALVGVMLWAALASLPSGSTSSGGSNVAVQVKCDSTYRAMFAGDSTGRNFKPWLTPLRHG